MPTLSYPSYYTVRKVSRNGVLYWNNLRGYAGYLLADEWVGLVPIDTGVWEAYFGPVRLGRFDERWAGGTQGDYLKLHV